MEFGKQGDDVDLQNMMGERMEEKGKYYEIRIRSNLTKAEFAEWFGGLTITIQENNEALISGFIVDQAALHGLLERIRIQDITLISVKQLPTPLSENM